MCVCVCVCVFVLILGGLRVARTRAHFQLKDQLLAAGIDENLRRTCLFCLFSKNICVLESEWHLLFYCPLFTHLRTGPLWRTVETRTEFDNSPHPCDILCQVLPLCIKDRALAQHLGTFIRLSLSVRGRWLSDTVAGGLHIDSAARTHIQRAQLYTTSMGFEQGVAIHL